MDKPMKLLRRFIEVDNNHTLPMMGTKVKTVPEFDPKATSGMFVSPKNLSTRKENTEGMYAGYVPGHGGDVVWVRHTDGSVAAYTTEELYYLGDK